MRQLCLLVHVFQNQSNLQSKDQRHNFFETVLYFNIYTTMLQDKEGNITDRQGILNRYYKPNHAFVLNLAQVCCVFTLSCILPCEPGLSLFLAKTICVPVLEMSVLPLSTISICLSWMWEHTRDCHKGLVGESGGARLYKFKMSGTFLKCLYSRAL